MLVSESKHHKHARHESNHWIDAHRSCADCTSEVDFTFQDPSLMKDGASFQDSIPHRSFTGGDAKYDERLLLQASNRRERIITLCQRLDGQLSQLEAHLDVTQPSNELAWKSDEIARIRACSFTELLVFRARSFLRMLPFRLEVEDLAKSFH